MPAAGITWKIPPLPPKSCCRNTTRCSVGLHTGPFSRVCLWAIFLWISGGLRETILVPYIIVVAMVGAGLTAVWVHFSLARSPLWMVLMALHPLFLIGAVGLIATIFKGFGLPTGA